LTQTSGPYIARREWRSQVQNAAVILLRGDGKMPKLTLSTIPLFHAVYTTDDPVAWCVCAVTSTGCTKTAERLEVVQTDVTLSYGYSIRQQSTTRLKAFTQQELYHTDTVNYQAKVVKD